MKLNYKKIQEISLGSVRAFERDGGLQLCRFTKEQEDAYREASNEFYNKTFSTAGIRLYFKTDSKSLFIKASVAKMSWRHFFSFDVFVNGKYLDSMDNFKEEELEKVYFEQPFPLGTFSKTFALGDGEKTVCVYLPWSVKTVIEEFSLDDGSFVEAIKPKKKLITFGDSITHGYDATRPHKRHGARIADALGAEETCKAIGGEKFFPELSKHKDGFEPDYITVAYGTNDWAMRGREVTVNNCIGFYTNLVRNYPDAKIFALTPIWRGDMDRDTEFGPFKEMEELIRNTVKDFKNVTVLCGYDFVPHDPDLFSDEHLHPNNAGFEHYYNNLWAELKKHI